MSCGQHVESLSRIDFLDRTYRYESVHSQIPQDVGFTLIVENFFPTGNRTSTKAHSVVCFKPRDHIQFIPMQYGFQLSRTIES